MAMSTMRRGWLAMGHVGNTREFNYGYVCNQEI
jgi:hypothetical protein